MNLAFETSLLIIGLAVSGGQLQARLSVTTAAPEERWDVCNSLQYLHCWQWIATFMVVPSDHKAENGAPVAHVEKSSYRTTVVQML